MSYDLIGLQGNLSTAFANTILDHLTNKVDYTNEDLYLALFLTACTDTTPGTEVSGSSYARVKIPGANPGGGQPYWASASSRASILAGGDVEFPVATLSGYTVTHIGFYNAASGGTYLGWGVLDTPRVIGVNERFSIPLGTLSISIPTTP